MCYQSDIYSFAPVGCTPFDENLRRSKRLFEAVFLDWIIAERNNESVLLRKFNSLRWDC